MESKSVLETHDFRDYLEAFASDSVSRSMYLRLNAYPAEPRFELLQTCLRKAATTKHGRNRLVTEECARLVLDILHEDYLVDKIIAEYHKVFVDPNDSFELYELASGLLMYDTKHITAAENGKRLMQNFVRLIDGLRPNLRHAFIRLFCCTRMESFPQIIPTLTVEFCNWLKDLHPHCIVQIQGQNGRMVAYLLKAVSCLLLSEEAARMLLEQGVIHELIPLLGQIEQNDPSVFEILWHVPCMILRLEIPELHQEERRRIIKYTLQFMEDAGFSTITGASKVFFLLCAMKVNADEVNVLPEYQVILERYRDEFSLKDLLDWAGRNVELSITGSLEARVQHAADLVRLIENTDFPLALFLPDGLLTLLASYREQDYGATFLYVLLNTNYDEASYWQACRVISVNTPDAHGYTPIMRLLNTWRPEWYCLLLDPNVDHRIVAHDGRTLADVLLNMLAEKRDYLKIPDYVLCTLARRGVFEHVREAESLCKAFGSTVMRPVPGAGFFAPLWHSSVVILSHYPQIEVEIRRQLWRQFMERHQGFPRLIEILRMLVTGVLLSVHAVPRFARSHTRLLTKDIIRLVMVALG